MRRLFGAGLGMLLGLNCACFASTNNAVSANTAPYNLEDTKILHEYNRPNVAHTIVTTNGSVRFNEGGRDYTLEVLKVNRLDQKATIRLSTPGWIKLYVQEIDMKKDYSDLGLVLRGFEVGDNGVVLMRTPRR